MPPSRVRAGGYLTRFELDYEAFNRV